MVKLAYECPVRRRTRQRMRAESILMQCLYLLRRGKRNNVSKKNPRKWRAAGVPNSLDLQHKTKARAGDVRNWMINSDPQTDLGKVGLSSVHEGKKNLGRVFNSRSTPPAPRPHQRCDLTSLLQDLILEIPVRVRHQPSSHQNLPPFY